MDRTRTYDVTRSPDGNDKKKDSLKEVEVKRVVRVVTSTDSPDMDPRSEEPGSTKRVRSFCKGWTINHFG